MMLDLKEKGSYKILQMWRWYNRWFYLIFEVFFTSLRCFFLIPQIWGNHSSSRMFCIAAVSIRTFKIPASNLSFPSNALHIIVWENGCPLLLRERPYEPAPALHTASCCTCYQTGLGGTSYTAYTRLSFPSNVLHTEKTWIDNGFERIRINTVAPCYLETADREALLWHGTSLYQIENGLEQIAIGIY